MRYFICFVFLCFSCISTANDDQISVQTLDSEKEKNVVLTISHLRKLTSTEYKIITKLVNLAKLNIKTNDLLVRPLSDGNMGSLAIGENYENRRFGEQVSEFTFKDLDGILVIASLNVDWQGDLYELDVFKVDSSPTQLLQ